jgi:hypothetical protein
MFVCCVLSGRGLCDELITRPEVSFRLWRVVVCDQEPRERGGHSPRSVAEPERENSLSCWSYYTDILRCTVNKALNVLFLLLLHN